MTDHSRTRPAEHDQRRFSMYIGGEFCQASDGATYTSVDPYARQPWATMPDATATDIDRAVAAAHRGLHDEAWTSLNGAQRAEVLRAIADVLEDNAEELAHLETMDAGKTFAENVSQGRFAAGVYRYYAGWADKILGQVIPLKNQSILDYVVYEPVGVCALLTAFNSPMQLLANKLPAALAAGNAAVIKPSEHNSASTLRFAELIDELGLPTGLINVVSGDGPSAGEMLVRHPDVDLVSLTGGELAGRAVAAAAMPEFKRLVMELGGKSPNIVFADADLERVVKGAAGGVFIAGGQTCVAGSRVLVEQSIYDEFLEAFSREAESWVLGDPLVADTDMGPLANEAQHERVVGAIDRALKGGATLVTGGVREEFDGTLFVPPTVLALDGAANEIFYEEVFGPVVAVVPFTGEAEAVALANDTRYGLAAGVWTRDISRAHRVASALQVSAVWINTYRIMSEAAPFGGRKASGTGRERGPAGLMEFLETKNVMIDVS